MQNMIKFRTALVFAIFAALLSGNVSLRADDQAAPPPPVREKLKELPPGNHKLLETMTKNFGLTMDQELEIEPLLHDEESVSKPILGFAAFTPEEQKAMLLTVKLATRRQIRPLLTAEQQSKLDVETAGLSQKSGKSAGAGGKGKKAAATTEEAVTKAILAYSALTDAEKQTMIAKVKAAAQRPPATQEQPAAKLGEVSPAETK